MARGPKSHKADGTPKKRWSPEQRAAAGRGSRRRGGQSDGAPRNRAERRAQQFGDAGPQKSRQQRSHSSSGWDGRGDKRGQSRPYTKHRRDGEAPGADVDLRFSGQREDRRFDRDDRRRDDRGGYQRRDARGYQGRDDRGGYRGRDDGGFQRRDDRPRFDRDDRRRDDSRGDRGYQRRDDRPRFDRDDRRRDDRGGYQRRDDRGFQRRDDRARFDREERRDSWRDRDARTEESAEQDQMSWEATEVEGVETENRFTELGVSAPMVGVLAAQGITAPFAIQEATIRDAIAGRDVLGRARTGSGKTLAFGLSLLTRLAEGTGPGPRAVVLSPTRELALQIADNLSPLAASVGLDLTLIAGGMGYGPQIRAFERGVDVIIATPGRLIDLMEQGAADLSNVEITVLDEADHMAEMGFAEEVRAILDATPEGGQRLLFSATLDDAVDRIVRDYLNDPIVHEVDSAQAQVTTMTHLGLIVKPHHKIELTAEMASREGKTVIFARTQKGTDRIAGQLRDAGVMAGALHGGLTQGARARILAAFKSGDVPVLVATDVAARGIHVDDVTLVLQVDPPRDSKDYLHRAGRTARAGTDGTVATIVLPHQRKLMRRIMGQAGVDARILDSYPGDETLAELTGSQAPSGEFIEESDYQRLIAPKAQPRRRPQRKQYGRRR